MNCASSLLREQAYVGGLWIGADDGRTSKVVSPANGAAIGSVPLMSRTEATRAIGSAAAALPAWRARTAGNRSAVLHRWFQVIVLRQEELAILLTSEQGKPLAEARAEIAQAAAFVEWFAEEAKRIYGDTIPAPIGDRRIVTLKQPVGVVAAITPWNFPATMVTRKLGLRWRQDAPSS